jgi:pSer/pThr/pTyr-binding forkhead associated (FHA) protein
MLLQIAIVSGPDKGRSFALVAGKTLQLGRSQATATKLTDPTVSRVHCEIDFDGTHAQLVNSSSSGTLVNGQPVTQHNLQLGDLVKIDNTEFRLRNADLSEASTIHENVPTAAAKIAGPAAGALAGQTLSNYFLEAAVAKGASGVLYKAKNTATGQTVAFKVLHPEFAKNEEEMQRFVRGMKLGLPLRHPNLIPLHKAGKTDAFCWMAMDFIEGENMREHDGSGPAHRPATSRTQETHELLYIGRRLQSRRHTPGRRRLGPYGPGVGRAHRPATSRTPRPHGGSEQRGVQPRRHAPGQRL